MGRAIVPISVTAESKACAEGNEHDHIHPEQVELFYAAKGSNIGEIEPGIIANMLFQYRHIADDFQKFLRNWFAIAENIRPVMDLYFGLYYIPSMYLHLQFLTLAQALETYHRRMYGGEFMSSEDYEPVRMLLEAAIPKTLDKLHKDRLKGMIGFGYEYSLRKRLHLILNEVLEPYSDIVGVLVGKPSQFVDSLVNTRNYLTHYSKESEKGAITDPDEQYIFVQKMKLLIQLCFFKEMGFSNEVVNRIMTSNQNFTHWSKR